MKADRSGINLDYLKQRVTDAYGLDIITLDFLPKGEEVRSANYVAEGKDGRRFLVKAQETGDAQALETVYEVLHAVHEYAGMWQVVAPVRSKSSAFVGRMGAHVIAVFPYIEGTSIWETHRPFAGDVVTRAALLIAGLHRSRAALDASLLRRTPREAFDHPFAEPIRRALATLESLAGSANEYQRQLRQLLLAEQRDLLATLEKMELFRRELTTLATELVVTHGDPNLANILVDGQGNLHLIDWGELALGPPERDLMFFTGPSFESFLRQYWAAYGAVRLHRNLFAFYHYRWAVQEIADFTTRILFRNTTCIEDEHAWAELQPYLPIQHREIEASMAATGEAVARLSVEWV